MPIPPQPPSMPAQPPTAGAPGPTPQASPAPAPVPPTGGGFLAPVTLARPSRDASGGSAAYSAQADDAGADSKPGKGEKNTTPIGMWKGIAALIANRPQQKMTVQHTISEIRGSSTDRKINHGLTEKRGATSDSKANRTATTTHASKSDKSTKTADTRDAKTSAASTKADRNSRDAKTADTRSAAKKDNRDAKRADTRTSADKTSRDAKTAADRKDHSTRQQADKTATDKQDRTTREDKSSYRADKAGQQPPESKVSARTSPAPKTGPESSKTADALTKPKTDPTGGPVTSDGVGPTAPSAPGTAGKQDTPRKGPYTARFAREDGFKVGAQKAAAEADKFAWEDGYLDGQKAIQKTAAHDKAQMDAARDRAQGAPPVPAKPPVPPATPPAAPPVKPTAPPKPATPPTKPSASPAAYTSQQNNRANRNRPQGAPPMPAKPTAPPKPAAAPKPPAPAMGAVPLGAEVSPFHGTVVLSNGKVFPLQEVRTLRSLTRFLTGKEQETHQIADQCKQAAAASAHRATEIQKLIEACKDPKIKAGNSLVASLQKLHEATTVQAKEAEKLNGNAARGIEALRTLNQNAEVRHGGVYKAVADSDENSTAERNFYNR